MSRVMQTNEDRCTVQTTTL